MSIKIRLRRTGAKNRPCFRLVAADSRSRRDGRFLDILGYYNPLPKPHVFEVKEDRVLHWMEQGAELSEAVRELLRAHGTLEKWRALQAGRASGVGGKVSEVEVSSSEDAQPEATDESRPV